MERFSVVATGTPNALKAVLYADGEEIGNETLKDHKAVDRWARARAKDWSNEIKEPSLTSHTINFSKSFTL